MGISAVGMICVFVVKSNLPGCELSPWFLRVSVPPSPPPFFFHFPFFSFPFEVRKTKDTSTSSDLPSNSHCQTQHRGFESEKRNMPVSALFLVSPKCSRLTREPCSSTREASRPAAQHPGQPSALRHRWQHPAHQVPNAVGTRAFPAGMLSASLRVENV